jgi:hypothetical protein
MKRKAGAGEADEAQLKHKVSYLKPYKEPDEGVLYQILYNYIWHGPMPESPINLAEACSILALMYWSKKKGVGSGF